MAIKCLLYLEIIDDFQNLILATIIIMFIVLRNNMSNGLKVYLLFCFLSPSTIDKFVIKKPRTP